MKGKISIFRLDRFIFPYQSSCNNKQNDANDLCVFFPNLKITYSLCTCSAFFHVRQCRVYVHFPADTFVRAPQSQRKTICIFGNNIFNTSRVLLLKVNLQVALIALIFLIN